MITRTIAKNILAILAVSGLVCLTGVAAAHAADETSEDHYSYGVDLRDVVRYKANLKREAQAVINQMTKQPELIFPVGVRYLSGGPGFNSQSRTNSVYGVEFTSRVALNENNRESLTANALYSQNRKQFFLRSFRFEFEEQKAGTKSLALKLSATKVIREIPIDETHLTIKVALAQRKMTVEDSALGLRKIYPLGVGSIDEGLGQPGKVRVLTPRYRGALIEKRYVESSRTYPAYYMGRPFIRLSVGVGGQTIYGFHYSITENLMRGFVSHGCMRMRDKDLYELFALVIGGGSDTLPVEMVYNDDDLSDHPYPLNNETYWRIKNFGTALRPTVALDREGLTILELRRGVPPISELYDALTNTFGDH